ncbi:hypothetical protein ACFQ7F_36775 [Streptomyces sp. NPDC056486]|uniref:hypothetical protein n=1 Tax=Streptomyces sp. NPDC056486 TaxID=3345835 RepID=UPI003678ECAA
MTPAAVVLPDAAVRMMRAVAGRRALQVVLLLAGLLALGFLCGERAHAVDGVPPSVSASASASTRDPAQAPASTPAPASARARAAEPVRETAREGRDAVRDAAVEPVADVAEPVARTVRGVVRPVVDQVTGVVEGAPQQVLPETPDISGIPELPQSGSGVRTPSPEGATPGDGQGEPRAPAQVSGARADSSYGTDVSSTTYPAGQSVRGAALFGGGDLSHDAHDAHRTTEQDGSFPTPPGDPARTLSGASAGDGSSTRHGDPCAASLESRAPVRLLQGAGAGQVHAPIRERHRDIPEFPG